MIVLGLIVVLIWCLDTTVFSRDLTSLTSRAIAWLLMIIMALWVWG